MVGSSRSKRHGSMHASARAAMMRIRMLFVPSYHEPATMGNYRRLSHINAHTLVSFITKLQIWQSKRSSERRLTRSEVAEWEENEKKGVVMSCRRRVFGRHLNRFEKTSDASSCSLFAGHAHSSMYNSNHSSFAFLLERAMPERFAKLAAYARKQGHSDWRQKTTAEDYFKI
eukprot:scaffold655_cov162-Amphora_coffeaeformis.AAC.2